VLSAPAQGPTDAADGLAAAGDVSGEAVVAWLQGVPGSSAIMVGQLYQPPGPFSVVKGPAFVRTSQPAFAWTRPRGWGPLQYSLTVDGAVITQTAATATAAPAPLPDGRHTWDVVAANPAGQQRATKSASVFIDTVAPTVKLKLRGSPLVARIVRARVAYADPPPVGEPLSDASGVARIVIRWGDGTSTRVRVGAHVSAHVYGRSGHYRITVLVSDRAGNVTRVSVRLKIRKPRR